MGKLNPLQDIAGTPHLRCAVDAFARGSFSSGTEFTEGDGAAEKWLVSVSPRSGAVPEGGSSEDGGEGDGSETPASAAWVQGYVPGQAGPWQL